ncbi:MAG: NAD(P)/FAD-dependent oxidoreductase [Actinomycetota bacterium]
MVVGSGFGGMHLVRALKGVDVDITLIDERNHHLFQPLLYQVATASLNPSDVAAPIRRIFRGQRNVEVMLGKVVSVDAVNRKVKVAESWLDYDYLVVATGVTHSYFGHDEWALHSVGLKSLEDALRIRDRLLVAFERAEHETDSQVRDRLMTFVVVGGGPTGVELAGALAEIARRSLGGDFRHIEPAAAKVILIEAGDRILPMFDKPLCQKAERQLVGLGVEVRTNTSVTDVTQHGVALGDDRINARNVFWAAGVKGSALAGSLGVPLDSSGRVLVEPDLSVPGHPEVFVIGDLAHVENVPGVAPAAMQMGTHAARCITSDLRGDRRSHFRYVDKGMLATIGRSAAVAQVVGLKLSGFIAWIAWLVIHTYFLIGFRNRFVVIIEWARAYFTSERQARLVTRDAEKVFDEAPRDQ